MRRTVHLPQWTVRPAVLMAVVAQLVSQVPLAATSQKPETAPPASSAQAVRVNRTVPNVRRPALFPVFSPNPTPTS